MPEEQPYVHFFDGKECWVKEELVSAAGLAYLADIDGVLRLRDEATGITLNVAVDGTDRQLFLARGRIGLTVEPVSVKRISSEATSELFAISVKQDGRTLLAGVGNPEDLLPSGESAPPQDAAEEPAEESSVFFEVSITDSEGREVVADSGDLLVSWIVDPKIRFGSKHYWSAGSYPTLYVNSQGTLSAGGTKVSFKRSATIWAMGFELWVSSADASVDYEMTGKNLYFNGQRYP